MLREVLKPSEVQAILERIASKIRSMVQVERGGNGTIILSKMSRESVQSPMKDVGVPVCRAGSHASTNLEPLPQS